MEPIETIYNGYRFRSRLEARWALFFDKLGVKYQYELEGFEYEDTRYLPDFFLPEFFRGVFIEVKPSIPTGYDKHKVLTFVEYGPKEIMLAVGDPATHKGLYYVLRPMNKPRVLYLLRFAIEPILRTLCLYDLPGKTLLRNSFANMVDFGGKELPQGTLNNPMLNDAYNLARQARFESGNNG